MSETSLGLMVLLSAASAKSMPATPHVPVHAEPGALPVVRLSATPYPEAVTQEDQYARWLADRTRLLLEAAGREAPPLQRIERRLAAVNWMLAAECEPPMSRMLQNLTTPADAPFVADLMQRCMTELAIARKDLQRYRQSPDHDADAAAGLADSIDALDCFAQALRTCAAPGADPGEVRRVASQLSVYLEDARPNVAAAALLWQAVLYERSDRLERAMRSLPLATAPLHSETRQYDFFARLLRCRYLAEKHAFATGWALLLMLEERAQGLPTQTERDEAARSVALARLTLCSEWVRASDDSARTATRQWCDHAGARLRTRYFPADADPTVSRLATAAPLIVEIPASISEQAAPAGGTGDAGSAPPSKTPGAPAAQGQPKTGHAETHHTKPGNDNGPGDVPDEENEAGPVEPQ